MPKLTRQAFLDARDQIWVQAIANFEHAGHLAPTLIGTDIKGNEHMWMGSVPPGPDASEEEKAAWQVEVAKAERNDITLLAGAWRDNLDYLRSEVDRLGIVAAIQVDEAWIARDALALEVQSMGITPGAHPMKEEVVLVHACWPREYVSTTFMRLITRDDTGRPYLVDVADTTGMKVAGWLDTILPPPPGKPRPDRPTYTTPSPHPAP